MAGSVDWQSQRSQKDGTCDQGVLCLSFQSVSILVYVRHYSGDRGCHGDEWNRYP